MSLNGRVLARGFGKDYHTAAQVAGHCSGDKADRD
jgi:hypothetical protein